MSSGYIKKHLFVERVTDGEGHYFFGYFDKYPWDITQRYLLTHRTDFMERQPASEDVATIGMIDLQGRNQFFSLAQTHAWCWQQGAMLQWINDAQTEIIYNDRDDGHFVARILDVKTGEKRTLCRPIYCLSADGRHALSINFSRLDKHRPGYGYTGLSDGFENVDHPDLDGVWLVDLKTNTARLIISVDCIVRKFHRPGMEGHASWFNHLLFSPDSKRFAFLHHWRINTGRYLTHMFTSDIDGSNIYLLNLDDMTSHFTWFENDKLICFANKHDRGWNYYEFTDKQEAGSGQNYQEFFKGNDGHCSYSRDRKWMLTDCYPTAENGSMRSLYLMDLKKNKRLRLGSSIPIYPCRVQSGVICIPGGHVTVERYVLTQVMKVFAVFMRLI